MATETENEVRDFAAVLLDLPQAHRELGEKLQQVVEAVRVTGKVGSITLKLSIAQHANNDQVIDLTPSITLAVPKPALRGGSFYPDKHNNVTKDDPATLWREDDLQDTPTAHSATGEIKEI